MKRFVSPYGATTRRNVVLLLLLFFALGVFTRVVYLQVYHADFLVGQGNSRFVRVKKEPALRGEIVDRNQVPLAVSTPVSSIWVNPKEIIETPEVISKLADLIGYPVAKLTERIQAKTESTFIFVRRGMEPSVAKHVVDKRLPGVYELREYRRFYPAAEVTSQIIGFNNIDDEGQEGIELSYNDWLAGLAGSSEIVRDRSGRVVDILQEIKPPVQGQPLELTIDKRIQYLTYLALLEAAQENNATAATAVVLDAKTSEILAMVSVPSGNPNNAQERKPALVKNRAITDTFEPGSVLKPFVVASAMDSGLITANTAIDTKPGFMKVGSHVVRDVRNYGELDVARVIKKSSNVGTCKIALRLPREKLHAMYAAVGFGQSSQIDFPGEQKGMLRDFSRMGDFEYCTNSYGYGISTNALQLAQAYAVLANDGQYIPATLVKQNTLPEAKRIISHQSAEAVRDMLALAVGDGGTGTRATKGDYMQDYSVAGKTGTVHKVIDGQYAKDRYRSVFAGFAPAKDPSIVMVVMVDDPQGDAYYGGAVAGPVFAKVVGMTLRILGVASDQAPPVNGAKSIQINKKDE